MKDLYFFSGLGAGRNVFQFINSDLYNTHYIEWIAPLNNESIESYALRLTEQIKSKNPILIGVSFGGLIAIEVAKHIDTEKVILISSAKTRKEIPFYFRIAGYLLLHKIFPLQLLKRANIISYWFFGTHGKKEKLLLKSILNKTDSKFLKWAIHSIVTWKNQTPIHNLVHIHGTKDRIIPYHFVKADKAIIEAGHFMVLNKASDLTTILNAHLEGK